MSAKIVTTVLAGALAAVVGTAALVRPWEGTELKPYRDLVGRLTWCTGETHGTPKSEYTRAECDALLNTSIAKHLTGVAACINKPLAQHEWVALGSWTYNVGVGAACRSTLVRKINQGRPATEWCRELFRWNRAGGKVVRGLTNRRKAEYQVCMGWK